MRAVLRIVVVLGALALFAPGTARANDCTITQPNSLVGTVPTSITFANAGPRTLDVYWLDYAGARVFYNTLGPFGSYVQSTWETHPWVVIDQVTGICVGYTIATATPFTYTIDTTAPTVTITSPPGGSDISGTIAVTADASDDLGVDHVTFEEYDGTTYRPIGTDSSPPYSVSFDTTTVPNCPHNACTIYAQAFDTSGNPSAKYGVGVGINNVADTTPPTASMTAPIDGATVSGVVWLGGSAVDSGGVATWAFQASTDGSSYSDITVGSGGGDVSTGWGTEGSGDYYIRLKAVDVAGNTGFSSPVLVHVDNAHPDDVLKVDAPGDFSGNSMGSLDPASPTSFGTAPFQVLDATCLHLVRHSDSSGTAGFAIEPDAATWTTDGLDFYSFTIKSGLTFSDGTPVTPASFVRGFERLLSPVLNPSGAEGYGTYFHEIVGADAYRAGAPTISGLSVSGNTLSIGLTRNDGAFLAKLAGPAACAVPETTPTTLDFPYLPMAGPYFVASYVPGHQLVLNARDNGLGRPHAFKQIVYKLNTPPATADGEVLSGAADYTTAISPSDESDLNGSYGPDSSNAAAGNQQLFIDDAAGVQFLAMNTQRTIFGNVAVRKALNVALDRGTLANAFGLHAKFSDQLLTPAVPGFTDANIYDPHVTDYTAARAAVAAVGQAGATVEFLGCTSSNPAVQSRCDTTDTAVTTSLARIGLNVHITHLPRAQQITTAATNPSAYDLTQLGWIADYPDPQGILGPLVDGRSIHEGPNNSNLSFFNDGDVNGQLDSADATSPASARFGAYGSLDVSVMRDSAPYAPFASIRNLTFISTRVSAVDAWYGAADLAAFHLRLEPTISLSADVSSAPAGAAATPESALDASVLSGAPSDTTQSAPLEPIPLEPIPLEPIMLAGSPLEPITLDKLGFTAANLAQNALGGLPLNDVPLKVPQTWEQKLAGTVLANVPVQTLTLANVVQSAPAVLSTIELRDLNLAASSLGQLSLAAAALGPLPLEPIPINGHTGPQNDTDWCNLIRSIPGFAAYDCSQIPTQTLMGLNLQGVPLEPIPLEPIPLEPIDLTGTPLEPIPLEPIMLQHSAIGSVKLSQIDMTKSPLANITTAAIVAAGGTAPCTGGVCPATIGAIAAGGLLKADATVADLHTYPGVTLGNIGKGMPLTVTLNDLLALLLPPAAFDWNTLPTDFPLQDYATQGGVVHYTAPFSIGGSGLSTKAKLTVVLTNGERYVPSSTTITGEGAPSAVEPDASISGDTETLVWTLDSVSVGNSFSLHFTAHTGLTLGAGDATASIDVATVPTVTSAAVPLAVTDTFEPNNTAAAAAPVASNTLYSSYITSAGDIDYFTHAIPPAGTQVKIFLQRLHSDDDLVVYGPQSQPLRSAPLEPIPLEPIAPSDPQPGLQPQAQGISTETLQDVPINPPAGQGVVGTSNARGTAEEEVDFVSTGQAGNLTIQVDGFNGATSDQPYLLRIEETPPPALPPCQPRTMGSGGTAGTMPAIAANVNTLFLVNEKQLGDLYGAAAEASVVSALNTTIANGYAGVVGAIVPVESNAAVAGAYSAWNADPCSPAKANDIVRSIGTLLDNISSGRPIQNVVIVGSDEIVPMGREIDPNPLANESEYASTLGYATNNEFISAVVNHFVLTDDPYGGSFNGQAYMPTVGLSRVVETPTEIVNQFNQFNSVHGQLNPTTALWTGYDFLSDGTALAAQASRDQGKTTTELNNNTWTRDQLVAALFPATNPPAITGLNAHYDQYRMLPADQNALHRQDVLFTTQQLIAQGAASTRLRNVLTIGCHSGFSAPDTIFGSGNPLALDWPQAYTGQTGAASFVGGTGYGLGDTVAVAYSEKLQVFLSRRLDGSLNVGRASTFAKQDYFGSLGPAQFSGYDKKAMEESTTYGIGLYTLGSLATPAAPPPLPTFTDGATGLTAVSVAYSPAFHANSTPSGTYYDVAGNTVNESRRPIEPLLSTDVTEPGLLAHDPFVTSLGNITDVSPFDAAFSTIGVDSSNLQPELVGLTNYPTVFAAVRSITTPTGKQQRLVFIPAEYRSDGIPDAKGVGTQVLYGSATVRVFYSASTNFTRPTLGVVTVDKVGGGVVGFSFDVGSAAPIKRALVLYRDGSTIRSVDAGCSAGHCSGAGPLSSASTEYYIQVVDANGNVGVTHDKGDIQPAVVQTSSGGVTPSVSGPQNGAWFTGNASVSFGLPTGVTLEYRLDGSATTPYTGGSFGVSGDGVHTVSYDASDGSQGDLVIPIDTTGPSITTTFHAYSLGSTGNTLDFTCADAGSGVASCAATPPSPDTTTVGTKSYSVHAVDRVGNTADATGSYQVMWPFRGFLSPVSNVPVLNQANSGQAIPVKFSLSGNRGLAILAAGSPSSKQIACDSTAPISGAVATSTAGSSGLTYDSTSDTYTYVWKTDKAWAGTCRQLDVALADGTDHVANFKFK